MAKPTKQTDAKTEPSEGPRNVRYNVIKRRNRTIKLPLAYLQPNPAHIASNPKYVCPKGPGLPPVRRGGEWVEVSTYISRRYACGDLTDAEPPKGAGVTEKHFNKTEPAPVAEPPKE